MNRALSVWWNDRVVGTLRINEHGEMVFQYSNGWLADPSNPPLSISLPKRDKPFKRRECRPFFAGLLPEEGQLEAIARKLGISKANDFRLLEALGGDVAGALTLWPEGERPPAPDAGPHPKPFEDEHIAEILNTLPTRPLLAGQDGLRLSLAGAQAKLPVVIVEGRIALPAPGQPTTHILKPPIERFPATTENEGFMMRLAAALDLSVARVEARTAAGKPYLLIARYDRHLETSGDVHRLHQEDFCQALGIPPEQKYAAEGGPTFKSSFDLLRSAASRPAVEVLKMLDAAVFNAIIGNADAHGKNFSLLYRDAEVGLAPLYDLVCTVAYADLSPRFAMKLAKCATLEEMGNSTWPAFANDVGLAAPYVRRRVGELAEGTRDVAFETVEQLVGAGLDRQPLTKFASLVTSRAARVLDTV